jgi:SAM-dependent methyltransferase
MPSRFWLDIPVNVRLSTCAILILSMFGFWFAAQRLDGWAWLPSVILLICGVLLAVIRFSWRVALVAIAFCGWCGILFIFSWVMTGSLTSIVFQRLQAVFSTSAYVIVGGMWVIGACRLTEWLDVAGRSSRYGLRLQDILATHAGAFASRSLTIRQQIDAFYITRLWAGCVDPKNGCETQLQRTARWLGDRSEFFFIVAAELVGGISMQLRSDQSGKTFDRKSYSLRLSELYDIPRFVALYKAVFDERPIASQWLEAISSAVDPGSSVLDLGAGTGRLSAVLVDCGFDVYAIESNAEFAQSCQDRLANRGSSSQWSVLRGAFPEAHPPRRVNAVILHRNVILELINEMASSQLWAALRDITLPGGKVLFDYPENGEAPAEGSVKSIVKDVESDNIRFDYSYRYVEKAGDIHVVHLCFSAASSDIKIVREPYLHIKFPSLESVLAEAAQFGFEIETKVNLSQFSFFPGEMKLLQLRSLV